MRTRGNDAYVYAGDVDGSRIYSVNGLNQYLTAGSASLAYDANGNLTSDGSTSFTYDRENRLVAMNGAMTASLSYDPLGRLVRVSDLATSTTRFLYDGDELISETLSGTFARRYVHGPLVDDPIVSYEGAIVSASTSRQLFADHQGSIVATTDASGTIIGAPNRYDDWGTPDASNSGRFQFTGQAWIAEVGLYHYKARFYAPTLGRFMQSDPIGYEDGPHLYAYVGNDPVNAADPTGTCGRRYDDGTCRVRVESGSGAAGVVAARRLETALNRMDARVNATADNAAISVRSQSGATLATVTGAEYKAVWNGTRFSVANRNFGGINGGGGATSGHFRRDGTISGRSRININTVDAWEQSARNWGRTNEDGQNALVLHEISHNTWYGLHLNSFYPVTPVVNFESESRASSTAKAQGNSIEVDFHCEVVGGGCQP